jgi:MoaA/NifB/PqqE/SkfB family radical SAM enzyme
LHCKYCYYSITQREEKELDKNTALRIAEKAKETGVSLVHLSGGEPLLYKYLFELIKKFSELDIKTILDTNGTLINEKNALSLVNVGLNVFYFSLDSKDPHYHNFVRDFSFEGTMRGMKNALELESRGYDVKTGVCTVVTRKNLNDLLFLLDFLIDMGVNYFAFHPIFLPLSHPLYGPLVLREEDYSTLLNMLNEIYQRENEIVLPIRKHMEEVLTRLKKRENQVENCFAGDRLLYIESDQYIYPCPSYYMIRTFRKIKASEIDVDSLKLLKVGKCSHFSEDCASVWKEVFSDFPNCKG